MAVAALTFALAAAFSLAGAGYCSSATKGTCGESINAFGLARQQPIDDLCMYVYAETQDGQQEQEQEGVLVVLLVVAARSAGVASQHHQQQQHH